MPLAAIRSLFCFLDYSYELGSLFSSNVFKFKSSIRKWFFLRSLRGRGLPAPRPGTDNCTSTLLGQRSDALGSMWTSKWALRVSQVDVSHPLVQLKLVLDCHPRRIYSHGYG
jgi:hypothetical protein